MRRLGCRAAVTRRRPAKPAPAAGQVRISQGIFAVQQTCPRCKGRGSIIKDPCPKCAGHGRMRTNKRLSVKVPPGVDNGDRIRLAGRGRGGPERRPGGRPLCRDRGAGAPDLRARRRTPVLRGAGQLHDGRPRRHRRSADARGQGQHQGAGRHAVRARVPPAREGHQARSRRRRPATCSAASSSRPRSNSARSRRKSCESSRASLAADGKRHNPRQRTWLDGVRQFFGRTGN